MKDKEEKQTELRKTQNNDVMEKYREEKDFTNDACNEHDKKNVKNALLVKTNQITLGKFH